MTSSPMKNLVLHRSLLWIQGISRMVKKRCALFHRPASDAALERECEVFARYLTGADASDYLRRKYREAHAVGVLGAGDSAFDRVLVTVARRGPWYTRFADTHARVFANGGLLRRKLVLVLALVECSAPARVDAPRSRSALGFLLRAAWLGAGFALLCALAALVFMPVRLACRLAGGSRA